MQRLMELDVFKDVTLIANPGTSSHAATLGVVLEEARPYYFKARLGVGTGAGVVSWPLPL